MTVLIGGVSQLYQGDLDLGRRAADRLSREDLGRGVVVEDLHYGAVAVAQRLEELGPDALILVGAAERSRPPGTVERRCIRDPKPPAAAFQQAVGDAVTGYVTIDLVVEVAAGLDLLPALTVAVEVEPASTAPSEDLSPQGKLGLDAALALVRAEARRAPALGLASEVRTQLEDGHVEASDALKAMNDLLRELDVARDEGRWGATFALKDRVKLRISEGATGEGMQHLDWGLWWTLLEELDRLQPLEGDSA